MSVVLLTPSRVCRAPLDHIRDDLRVAVKGEISGLFANLETRLEHRIAAEIEERLPHA
jgi:hypothetical protein